MGSIMRIARVWKYGEVESIHVQYAQPKTTGLILLKHFSEERQVTELFDARAEFNGLVFLKGKPKDYPDSYKDLALGTTVVEPDDINLPRKDGFVNISIRYKTDIAIIDSSYKAFCSAGHEMERFFIYWHNKWWFSSRDIEGQLIPLGLIPIIQDMVQPYDTDYGKSNYTNDYDYNAELHDIANIFDIHNPYLDD